MNDPGSQGLHHVTEAALDAALDWVAGAPPEGRADMLCRRPGFSMREFPGSLRFDPERGIENERWLTHPWLVLQDGSPDPRIQVSVLSRRVLELVWRDRARTLHPGDTVITDMDLSVANLPAGTRLRAGSAVLEVSDLFNDACAKWKARYGPDAYHWVKRPEYRHLRLRGILCRIAEAGCVRLGDALERI